MYYTRGSIIVMIIQEVGTHLYHSTGPCYTGGCDPFVFIERPRNRSKAVPEGNGPFPHHDEFGSGEPTMAEVYRMLEELFDRSDKQLDELKRKMGETNQRLADLQHEAWQPRLATEADVEPDTKIRKRAEGAAAD